MNDSLFLAPNSDFVTLQIAGAKAEMFLQGQFTSDVLTLQPRQAMISACCDHKGRILANGWLGRWQEHFLLLLPKNMVTMTVQHLQKFAVFSKVTIQETTDWIPLNYAGPALSLPPDREWIQGQLPLPHPSGHFWHWLMVKSTSLNDVAATLARQASPMPPQRLSHFNVLSKLAFIEPATRELFIPQMLGMENLGGISFTKGCYVGQEVIARTQHLGQLKRHLHTLKISTMHPLQAGEALFNSENEIMGQIATVSPTPAGGYELLAVIQDRAISFPLFTAHHELLSIIY